MVWRNLIRNPNTYACALGFIWSLISFRWNIKIPLIVDGSILILSKTGTGMAMFSIGLYMALQPKLVACGNTWAIVSMVARFVVGPTVIAVTAISIGIRGVLLRIAIIQIIRVSTGAAGPRVEQRSFKMDEVPLVQALEEGDAAA
ncbi:hypothetical protein VIGAN_02280300 [Vigna angularis var. angularis]|uniref:Auxin efflux carrier component n=1 Tax=Vigna angularis var. angularis TaxID=157739 RepID=A0A0S3RH67_PHAAN|nr:hypothetical protein VIGAN_02280300 [Vigna angularis var. angularis]